MLTMSRLWEQIRSYNSGTSIHGDNHDHDNDDHNVDYHHYDDDNHCDDDDHADNHSNNDNDNADAARTDLHHGGGSPRGGAPPLELPLLLRCGPHDHIHDSRSVQSKSQECSILIFESFAQLTWKNSFVH